MRNRFAAAVLVTFALAGCATPGTREYYEAVAKQAEYRADAERTRTNAIMELARTGDATTKTVAAVLLAAGGAAVPVPAIAPPEDAALAWARVIVPFAATIAGGFWQYRTSIASIEANQAVQTGAFAAFNGMATTQAGVAQSGFAALGAGLNGVVGTLPNLVPNVTTTTNTTTTNTTNTTTTDSNNVTRTCTGGSGGASGPGGGANC